MFIFINNEWSQLRTAITTANNSKAIKLISKNLAALGFFSIF